MEAPKAAERIKVLQRNRRQRYFLVNSNRKVNQPESDRERRVNLMAAAAIGAIKPK